MKTVIAKSFFKRTVCILLVILTVFAAAASTSAAAKNIGLSKAKSIALSDAGLESSAVTFTKTKLDTEDGIKVYDVEFRTKSKKYEYEIDAKSGRIIEKETEKIKTSAASSSYIGVSKAKSIALKDAGLKSSAVTFTKTKLDTEDGIKVYDVEFRTKSKKYEYEIDAKSGRIIEKETEKIKSSAASSSYIGVSKAKSIALKDAELKSSAVTFTKTKLDTEDGVRVYDVEFRTKSRKYEYEINAKSGRIIEKETEKIKSSAASSSYIGLSKAKSIALSDAGLESSAVTFTKTKLDTEDGVRVYDVEFRTKSRKYEYEINAKSGRIIEKETERIR